MSNSSKKYISLDSKNLKLEKPQKLKANDKSHLRVSGFYKQKSRYTCYDK